MKFWNTFLLLITAFALTSCFNTSDELWIESDGSGRFQTTTDMSNIYPFLMMGMEQEMNKEDEEGTDVETKNKGKEIVKNLFMSDNVDTTFNFGQILTSAAMEKGKTVDEFWEEMEMKINEDEDLPAAQKESVMNMMEIVTHMNVRLQASKTDQLLKTTTTQDFAHVSELSSLSKDFTGFIPHLNSDEPSKVTPDQLATVDQIFNSFAKIDLSGNTLRIRRSGLDLSDLGEEAASVAPMLGMFLGTAPYRLVIHLPGKVKKTSKGVEVIDKKTIAIEMPLSDLFDPEKSIDYEIQFKGLKK